MKKITKIFAVLTAAFGLLAVSCKGATQSKVEEPEQGIKLIFNNEARTILPTVSLEDLTDIVITGVEKDDETEEEIIFGSYSSISSITGFLPVKVGTWNILVTAKCGLTEFKAFAKEVVVTSGNVTPVELKFEFSKYGEMTTGKGAINLVLSYPGNDVSVVSVALLTKDYASIIEKDFIPVNNKVQIYFDNIDSGVYYLLCNLKGGDEENLTDINYVKDYVIVSAGCESYSSMEIKELNDLHSITYVLNGGEFGSDTGVFIPTTFTNLYVNVKLPTSSLIQKDYYYFDGWYTTENFADGTKILGWTEGEQTEDLTVYAKWEPITYTVSYVANGGTDAEGNAIENKEYKVTSDAFDLPVIVKDYYNFDGWYSTATFVEGTEVTEIDVTAPQNYKLYAKWSLRQYPIEWDVLNVPNMDAELLQFEAPSQEYFDVTNPVSFVFPEATYPGYILIGWVVTEEKTDTPDPLFKSNVNYSGSAYFDSEIDAKADKFVIYAMWDREPITVSFESDYGTAPESIKLHSSAKIMATKNKTVPSSLLASLTDENTGFTSLYWYKSTDETKTPVTTSTTYDANTVLKAAWKNRYTVSYESDYGTAPESFVVEQGTLLTSDNLSTITDDDFGFTSKYWYISSDETKAAVTTSTAVNSNITLKAKWSDRYTVTYDINDSHVTAPETITLESGTKLSEDMLPIYGYSGHAIKGWFVSTDTDETIISPDTFAVISDITLKAKWIAGWKITYISDYGTTPEITYIGDGEALTSFFLPTLETEGWVHKGWNYSDDTIAQIGDVVTSDIILSAYWYDMCTVIYETPYGVAPLSFECSINSKFTQAQLDSITEASTGFESLYWYFKNDSTKTPITTATSVPRDVTIVAAWKERYTISYTTAYETAPETKVVEDGYVLTKADLPKLTTVLTTDYFGGWYFGSEMILKGSTVTSDMNLVALWDANVLFTIDFDTNMDVNIPSLAVAPGTVLTAEDFPNLEVPVGYGVTGWYDEEGNLFNGTSYTVTDFVTFTENAYFGKCFVNKVGGNSSVTISVEKPQYAAIVIELLSDKSTITSTSYNGTKKTVEAGKKYICASSASDTFTMTVTNSTSELDIFEYRVYFDSIDTENDIHYVTSTTSVSGYSNAACINCPVSTGYVVHLFYLEAGKTYNVQWFDRCYGHDNHICITSLESGHLTRSDDTATFTMKPEVSGVYGVLVSIYNSYTSTYGSAYHIYCQN